MRVPSVKEIIFYKYEMNVLQAEALVDLILRGSQRVSTLLLDIDGSRKIREKGIILRLNVIEDIISLIKSTLMIGEHVFWYGNDEILIVFENVPFEESVRRANEIRVAISQHHIEMHEPVENASFSGSVTVTGGIVSSDESRDISDIIRLAKIRITQAKQEGRNCINATQNAAMENYLYKLTQYELNQLEQLSHKRGRELGCLLREAVDTLLLHYPQFHGHRKDREQKVPADAFYYATKPTVRL
ncbi:GGDEF domain-containing protein [Paenibacillus periandrae]|uniref:GGDEF domain-containing protein n=1 Tax=Paenibacillus periandrae TaxID=1761741 RepID=UPI001F08F247|nr:diguanylate cyclase [Paenibacillus periandrae]